MGTDLLNEQYNQLMENQKLKIKRLKEKHSKLVKEQSDADVCRIFLMKTFHFSEAVFNLKTNNEGKDIGSMVFFKNRTFYSLS
jgi:hypothetical protein